MLYIAIVVILLGLLLLGLPVAFVLGFMGLGTMLLIIGPDLMMKQVPLMAFQAVNSFTLIAVPGFILTGELLLRSNMGEKLFTAADQLFRHVRGGLAMATVVVCGFFAAISGSSVATAMSIGKLSSNEMLKKGYPKKFVFSTIAAAGTLGILIPPSTPLIVYGSVTETSVLRLFTAAVIPGILLMLLFLVYIFFKTRKFMDKQERVPWKQKRKSLKSASLVILIPIVMFGGMYTGFFTPAESAAVSAALTFLLGTFVYKGINRKNIMDIISEAASSSAMIFYIIIGALIFGHALTIINLPTQIGDFISQIDISTTVIILLILALLVILGMFLEVLAILLIVVPTFFPIMMALGIDPIWFAVMFVIVGEMALITPPVGLNLFVMSSVAEKIGIRVNPLELGLASAPYLLCMVFLALLILFIPSIALWLPNIIYN